MTEDHHEKDENKMPDKDKTREMGSSGESISPWTRSCQFLTTTQKIIQFSNGRDPKVNFSFSQKFDYLKKALIYQSREIELFTRLEPSIYSMLVLWTI